jgi:hypothetical protein
VAARIEDDTLRLGLLAEAVQGQQTLAGTALERLREHTAGLDAIVREEIRHTLVEELRSLGDDSRRAGAALRRLQRAAGVRVLACCLSLALPASALPVVLLWRALPSAAEMSALAAQRETLVADIGRLDRHGGKVELRRCGPAQRLCVRVERSAPSYGEAGDFLVVKGY